MPQPDIVWYKDAVPISPVKTPRYRVLAGGSLQVNGLLPDDTGMFQCFARNQAGEVQTNTYLAVTSEFIRPSLSPDYSLSCSHTLMHKYMWTFISSASLSVCLFLSQSERLWMPYQQCLSVFLSSSLLSLSCRWCAFCWRAIAVINTLLWGRLVRRRETDRETGKDKEGFYRGLTVLILPLRDTKHQSLPLFTSAHNGHRYWIWTILKLKG